MGKITDLPTSISTAGQNKNYTAPASASVVLVKGNATPSNRPRTAAIADAYITAELAAGRAYQTTVNHWNPMGALQLPIGLADSTEYSYVRVTLLGNKWYGFITSSYLNKTVSVFDIHIDRLATYGATLGHSTVLRGHVAVAASQSDTYGDQYCLEPEPIAVSSIENEYSSTSSNLLDPNNSSVAVISTANLNAMYLKDHFNYDSGIRGYFWDTAVALEPIPRDPGSSWSQVPVINRPPAGSIGIPTGPDFVFDQGVDNILGLNNPFAESTGDTGIPFVYNVPFFVNTEASKIDGVVQAGGLYIFETIECYNMWMASARFCPWVTDNIKAAYLIPKGHYGVTGATTVLPYANAFTIAGAAAANDVPIKFQSVTTSTNSSVSISNWRDNLLAAHGAAKYRKIITSQFTSIQLSDRNSTVRIYPELQTSVNATATIARAILPFGGTYRARFTNTVLADERATSVAGEIRTEVSVQGSGQMATLGSVANQSIIAGWHTRVDVKNSQFHNNYNRYAQSETNIGEVNKAYTQNLLSTITGGMIG